MKEEKVRIVSDAGNKEGCLWLHGFVSCTGGKISAVDNEVVA